MHILDIDHINITGPAELLEAVAAFYCDVLGFSIGTRPNFSRPGYWLYASGRPMIHLTQGDVSAAGSTSSLDHIAFKAIDLPEAIRRLAAHKIQYQQAKVEELGQTQLFLRDPAGNGVELNFDELPQA